MIELKGKFNTAKVYTDNIDSETIGQVIELCNQEFAKDSIIRIMPDTHAGKGCVIGTTMTIKDKVVPNLVGVDIGCGMFTVKLAEETIDFEKLDKVIREHIPCGFNTREHKHSFNKYINLDNLKCFEYIDKTRAKLSIGTLGGGNHFIEINKDKNNDLYLVIHSGSRNLGNQVAKHYQNLAIKDHSVDKKIKEELIAKLKKERREKDIEKEIRKLPTKTFNKDLAYLEGENFLNYIHDMQITQTYAKLNREAIAQVILEKMKLESVETFTTVHNYISEDMILRKGSISAKEGEKVLIPINMRDGSIVAIGKGNPDWNYSAPHGAGRILSRGKAKETLSLDEFKEEMKEVWTTSVGQRTLDESPMAYKPIEEIIENINDAVEVIEIIRPLYNFKAN